MREFNDTSAIVTNYVAVPTLLLMLFLAVIAWALNEQGTVRIGAVRQGRLRVAAAAVSAVVGLLMLVSVFDVRSAAGVFYVGIHQTVLRADFLLALGLHLGIYVWSARSHNRARRSSARSDRLPVLAG